MRTIAPAPADRLLRKEIKNLPCSTLNDNIRTKRRPASRCKTARHYQNKPVDSKQKSD